MIEALERDLPPATLLLGPQLDTLLFDAQYAVLKTHLAYQADTLILRYVSAADARNIVKFAGTAPFGPFKAVIAALDGSTAQAQNILLKVLEEPPPTVRFILAATSRPLATIVSRCEVVAVPAVKMAEEPDPEVASKVDAALAAAVAGDLAGLDKALRGWDDLHHAVMCVLLAEAAAGRDLQERITPAQARKLLGALGRFDAAHPRLAAHAALITVLVDQTER